MTYNPVVRCPYCKEVLLVCINEVDTDEYKGLMASETALVMKRHLITTLDCKKTTYIKEQLELKLE